MTGFLHVSRRRVYPGCLVRRGAVPVYISAMQWARRIDGARPARIALGLFLAFAVVYLATATYTSAQINDTRAAAVTAWSLGQGGGFTLPSTWLDIPWPAVSVDGEVLTDRFPGTSVLAAPFYALWPGSGTDPGHAFEISHAPAGVAAAVMTAAAMAVLFLVLDRTTSRRAALLTTGLVALGTSTWAVSADALFTHGPGQLALALGMLGMSHRRWAAGGLAFAVAVVVRPQLGVVAAVVGIGLAVSRRSLRPVVGIGSTSLLGVVALSVYTRHFFGSWLPIAGYNPGKVTNVAGAADPTRGASWLGDLVDLAGAWGLTLVHPLRGLFFYSPVLLVLAMAAALAWRSAPDWVRWSAVAGVVALTVQLLANPTWHGGDDFFAYRLPLEMVTMAAPLLAMGAERALASGAVWRGALVATGVASVVVFALGNTLMDPRRGELDAYFEMVDELGPNGEGYVHRDAFGPGGAERFGQGQ